MFSIAVGSYVIRCRADGLPVTSNALKLKARLLVEDPNGNPGSVLCFVSVHRAGTDDPILVVTQTCEPGPNAGFHPGIAFIPETNILFLGAGRFTQAFDLSVPRQIWRDEAEMGFWGWARHGDAILMSAELELAAWDIRGRKLWTTFVEPPWNYAVSNDMLELNVMGTLRSFPVFKGPK